MVEQLTSSLSSLDDIIRSIEKNTPTDDSWSESFRFGDYAHALRLVERHLEDAPQELGGRLWWVLCQLHIDALPMSALSAPLEEISEGLKQEQALHPIAVVAYARVACRLLERNQYRLGVSMLERALEFAELSSLSVFELAQLRSCLQGALRAEIDRAEVRRESTEYVSKLKARLLVLENLEKKEAPQQKASSTESIEKSGEKKRKKVLNAKSIIADSVALADQNTAQDQAENKKPFFEQAINNLKTFVHLLWTDPLWRIAALVTPALFFVVYGIVQANERQVMVRSRLVTSPEITLQMNLPLLAVRAGGAASESASALDRLTDRLNKMSVVKSAEASTDDSPARATEPPDALPGQRTGLSPTQIGSLAPVMPPDSVPNSGISPKLPERSDTGNPFQADAKWKDGSFDRDERLAALSAKHADRVQMHDLGTAGRGTPVDDLSVGPDGRVFGPPRDAVQGAVDGTTMDGKPVNSYEVQQYPKPQLYRTLTRTQVLSSPSIRSVLVSQLDANSVVEVTSRMGPWLEIRSVAGKRGYIYSQDAVEDRAN